MCADYRQPEQRLDKEWPEREGTRNNDPGILPNSMGQIK